MNRIYPFSFIALLNLFAIAANAQIQNPKNLSYSWNTDTSKRSVELNELTLATEKDEVHVLDYPGFISRSDSSYSYYDFEPVIAIQFGGQSKAYPLSVLTLFELSNDTLGGKPLMITYCPMCNAAIVFNRNVSANGVDKTLHFGISGILMHNDMVMYDRETNTWWEQLMGSGIAGEFNGYNLEMMPAMLISAKDYFDRYPDGKILAPVGSEKFGKHHQHRPFYHLDHSKNHIENKYYFPEKTDPRLPPLERVLDIHVADHSEIFPYSVLDHMGVVNEKFDNLYFTIFYHKEMVTVLDADKLSHAHKVGSATAFRSVLGKDTFTFYRSGNYFKDNQTNSTWDITGYCREGTSKGKQLWLLPHSSHFAFAYLAFFPQCTIYKE